MKYGTHPMSNPSWPIGWNYISLSKVNLRQVLYGKSAPYEVRDSIIYSTLSWTGYPEYMACLIFALEGNPNSTVLSSAEAGKRWSHPWREVIAIYDELRQETKSPMRA